MTTLFPFSQSHLRLIFKAKVPFPSLFHTIPRSHGRPMSRITGICMEHVGLPSTRKPLSGFRMLCTGEDLTTKKCVPCNSNDLRPMTEDAAKRLIRELVDWNLVNEDSKLKLSRSLKVKSFLKGMELFQLIAEVAEAEGHHPDLHLVGWNNVTIEISTHAVGGLTENDFILASKISKLDVHHLLSRKVSISSQHDC
ncbi:putative pterin-4-alpha-carbinolamine dehydratase isoform X1 [Cucumis melo var. makuwa]|uniref:4a-hydroxytetrahydrobiopterin dehydratase n=2 Tax=Cucumis melo TaxID=3656 RepID=A0A1S3AZX5_CUCME|nr:pterin-4-alpha-carbinolamine dehydratase 2, mitochondrial [Cucumis melo]KAA0052567.1 putative pterin-4-alpha-carbinolamine dehydratase isoform X1 [Cucumis melo var. makuwa]TYK13258.1 putative pterin-4-alpha-carbinolamine dehydratase isoform X1 [Cucumis melo var. makuwa]